MTTVPVIDITGCHQEGPALDRVAAQVDDACRRVGFLQLAGHGIDPEVLGAMLEAAERFFHGPESVKRSCRPPSPEINRGWAPLGSESLAYSLGVDAPPDLFEAFNIGHEFDFEDPLHVAEQHRFFAPNLWPEGDVALRDALLRYWDAAEAVAHRLTAIFAAALGMPWDFFEQHTGHSPDVMRVNWYERSAGAPAPTSGQQRMGAHTDYGVLTVLYADPVPGLEIVGPDGSWTSVVPEEGCLLVNLGDLLAQWTNDRWRSTLHRVAPPMADDGGPALRRSVAFFHEADADALVEPLPTCVSVDQPARYGPVTAGQHLIDKLMGPRELRPSVAASTVGDRERALRA